MKRIAVALDFDEEAPDILDTALQLGKNMGAEIHLVHVYPPEPVPVMAPDAYSYLVDCESPEEHEELLQEEKTKIRAEVSKLRKEDINAQGYMKPEDKNVAHSILDFSTSIDADMIVMGTNRPGRLERLFLGSCAEAILRQSTIPVLVIPRRDHSDS
jgi:nucleotide-binding universal stress UspA family protein